MKSNTAELSAYVDSPALVIDDDSASREIMIDLLKELGFSEIIEKSNGEDAMKFIDSNKNWRGIVLSDWNMPKMSGADLYAQVKTKHPNIPFIIVTGRNDEESVMYAKDTGIYAYIVKPYSLAELEKKVNKVSMKHAEYLYDPTVLTVTKSPEIYNI